MERRHFINQLCKSIAVASIVPTTLAVDTTSILEKYPYLITEAFARKHKYSWTGSTIPLREALMEPSPVLGETTKLWRL